jgi:hypothetical protein
MRLRLFHWVLFVVLPMGALAQTPNEPGGGVSYQLPVAGPLPQTYRVTLAVVDAKNPDFIVSEFATGVVRTVTAANQGGFTEHWNGLDDNFMPVPPGTYGVKGIYMAAQPWPVDGQYHSIVPRFATGASSWMPPVEDWKTPMPFNGDPCDAPLTSVAVGANGHAVFYYGYLENGANNPTFDLNKPMGWDQFIRSWPSGGAGGGEVTATDGDIVWSVAHEGCPDYVYRADGKPFGTGHSDRDNVYIPEGKVTAMAGWRDVLAGRSFLCLTQRGRMLFDGHDEPTESATDFVDKVTFLDGGNGTVLAELPLRRPQGLAIRGNILYALHTAKEGKWEVVSVPLEAGHPRGSWTPVFSVPDSIKPFDLAVDGHGAFYLSDPAANHVYRLNMAGNIVGKFGVGDRQKPGSYDRDTMMSPSKLAAWTDLAGQDRVLVVEQGGPNRVGEWSPEGKLIREFLSYQTRANHGYAVNQEHPDELYIQGQQHSLLRFHVDVANRDWRVDAVWPLDPVPNQGFGQVGDASEAHLDHPKLIRIGGREYLACARGYVVYRHDGDRWILSAAFLHRHAGDEDTYSAWHDANGNGRIDPGEIAPLGMPKEDVNLFRYQGEQFLDDLSLVSPAQGGRSVYRLAPAGFDRHGNPIFRRWEKLLTDPFLEARAHGKPDALHGGNELADTFSSDWAEADGSMADGFYVTSRGGKDFSANNGAQDKISRYVPDGHGGYRLKWRTGREAFGPAQPGEMIGAMHLHAPINGLLSVIDQSRCGVLLYTDDGLYVDTLFPDGNVLSPEQAGVYSLPGEYFAGDLMADKNTGKIYCLLGKETPMLYETEGWTTTENPVHRLDTVQKLVTIEAGQIAAPSEMALSLRGGAGTARYARFSPALGGAVLDGSMSGWSGCAPVVFQADAERRVEVRCLYDPDHLYLRWHAQLGTKFNPKPLAPLERIFTHDRHADTLSFYIQGDPNAPSPQSGDGRPGDVRFVFGVFRDGGALKPAALGLYPVWPGGGGTPQTYETRAGGRVTYAQAGPVPGVELHAVPDADGKGFVLTAAIPRTAIPGLPPFGTDLHTMVDFEATFGGHEKFWWANSDGSASSMTYDEPTEARFYPGAWAPAGFQGFDHGVVVRDWLVCGPFGGGPAKTFYRDPSLAGRDSDPVSRFFDAASYPPERGGVDPKAVFTGDMIRGYWPDPGEERWKPRSIADLDTRVIFGDGAQMWYAASWIYVPKETALEFDFQGRLQAILTYFVNGENVHEGELHGVGKDDPGNDSGVARVAAQTVTLHRGWNEILLKGYCIGCPPFRAGLILNGPPEKLWTLRLSGVPPAGPFASPAY